MLYHHHSSQQDVTKAVEEYLRFTVASAQVPLARTQPRARTSQQRPLGDLQVSEKNQETSDELILKQYFICILK